MEKKNNSGYVANKEVYLWIGRGSNGGGQGRYVWKLHIAKVGSIPSPYSGNVEEQK